MLQWLGTGSHPARIEAFFGAEMPCYLRCEAMTTDPLNLQQ